MLLAVYIGKKLAHDVWSVLTAKQLLYSVVLSCVTKSFKRINSANKVLLLYILYNKLLLNIYCCFLTVLLYTLTLNSPNGFAIINSANIINVLPTALGVILSISTVIYSMPNIVSVIIPNKPMPIPKCFNVSIITPTVKELLIYNVITVPVIIYPFVALLLGLRNRLCF
jgi:hypothetical protein